MTDQKKKQEKSNKSDDDSVVDNVVEAVVEVAVSEALTGTLGIGILGDLVEGTLGAFGDILDSLFD